LEVARKRCLEQSSEAPRVVSLFGRRFSIRQIRTRNQVQPAAVMDTDRLRSMPSWGTCL